MTNFRNLEKKVILVTGFADSKPVKCILTTEDTSHFFYFEPLESEELKAAIDYCKSINPNKPLLYVPMKLIEQMVLHINDSEKYLENLKNIEVIDAEIINS